MRLRREAVNKFALEQYDLFLFYIPIVLSVGLVGWLGFIAIYHWGPAWQHDYPSYHLPFMAHDLNVSTWELWPNLIPTWEGYPPLVHLLQGSIIWLTGLPALANGINLIALALFLPAARAINPQLRLSWLITGLMAVPLFVLNFPTGGIDIFFCLGVLIQFMCLVEMLQGDRRNILPILFVAAAGIVINSKMNGWAVTIFLSSIFALHQLRQFRREPADVILTLVALALVMGIWPLRTWIVMGSPAWPFRVPHLSESGVPASSYFNPTVRPDRLANTAKPIRYVLSFFEITRFMTSEPMRWSFTMWHFGPQSPHQMMGGLNGALMASWVTYFAMLLWQGLVSKPAAFLLAGCTLVAAILPQSHEMRYSLYVPMILLYVNLIYGRTFYRRWYELALLIGLAMTVLSFDVRAASTLFTTQNQLFEAHPQIKHFWKTEEKALQDGTASNTQPICIPDTEKSWELADPLGIYFTGPTLKTYNVKSCRPDCTSPWQDCFFEW